MSNEGTAAADPRAEALAGRISAAIAAIAARADVIGAAAPLPPDARIGHDEDAWGPREVLAHIAEAVPYWHGEIERILASYPAAVPNAVGRTADDVVRTGSVAQDRTLPAFVLLDRLGRDAAAVTARIRALTGAELDRVGRHPAWGDVTIAAVIERTLAGHLEGHAKQLDASLG
jgi:hypothetical protein